MTDTNDITTDDGSEPEGIVEGSTTEDAGTADGSTPTDAKRTGSAPFSPTTYKVLGELSAPGGTGVLGRNTATTGTAAGVTGLTASPGGYGLATPDDALVEGGIATVGAHEVTVDGNRALLVAAESGDDAGNVVAGHSSNGVATDVVGATSGQTGWTP